MKTERVLRLEVNVTVNVEKILLYCLIGLWSLLVL